MNTRPQKIDEEKTVTTTSAISIRSILQKMSAYNRVKLADDTATTQEGAYNSIKLKQVLGLEYSHANETTQANISITERKPIKEKSEEDTKSSDEPSIRPLELLHRKNIPHIYLYHDQSGILVSEKADCDYFEFITKNYFKKNWSTYRDFIGQILLKVHALHAAKLVHRDIKGENFLVYSIDDQLCLELIDYDDVVEVDEKGFAIIPNPSWAGTSMFMPIETYSLLNISKPNNIDLFAADCYAVGCLMVASLGVLPIIKGHRRSASMIAIKPDYKKLEQEIYFHHATKNQNYLGMLRSLLPNINQEGDPLAEEWFKLIISLLSTDPSKRPSIGKVMENAVFGATEAERKAYFANLAKRTYQLSIHGEPVPLGEIKEGDASWLLPKSIRNIIKVSRRFEEEISEYRNELVEQAPPYSKLFGKMDHLKLKAFAIQKLSTASASPPPPEFADDLTELNSTIGKTIDELQSSTETLGLQAAVQQALDEFQETYKPDQVTGLYSEKITIEFGSARRLLAEIAKKTVAEVLTLIVEHKSEIFAKILEKTLESVTGRTLSAWKTQAPEMISILRNTHPK